MGGQRDRRDWIYPHLVMLSLTVLIKLQITPTARGYLCQEHPKNKTN